MTSNNWGGTRKGAGRPKIEQPKRTVVVRLDELLLPAIKILKERHQSGEAVETLFTVTNNQNNPSDSNVISLDQYKQANIKLVQKYDRECLRGVQLQGKIRSKDSTIKSLKLEVEKLKHLEHDCQALTKSGTRCSRPSKVKIQYKGIEINTCLQHRDIN